MKNYLLLLFTLILIFSGCKEVERPMDDPIIQRGQIIASEKIASYTSDEIKELVKESLPVLFTALIVPQYDIDLYKVEYYSIDANNELTMASGAVAIPLGAGTSLPWVSYQHGTVVLKENVPSRGIDNAGDVLVGLVMASDGLICLMPDYLGMGDSPGLHPYVHAKTEANAGIDLMRATRFLSQEMGIFPDQELFLVGYSQGGHATMAMHKAIEEDYPGEFNLTASAPMAGPYSLSETMADLILSEEPYEAPYYLPYVMLAYNDVYQLYDSPSDFLASPYDQTLPPLFDGLNSGGVISQAMPDVVKNIIRDDVIEGFKTDPNHPFRTALADNDLFNWKPKAPIRLFHCEGDELVGYANSEITYAAFQDKGAEVTFVTPDEDASLTLGHGDCALPSLLGARQWFLEIIQ